MTAPGFVIDLRDLSLADVAEVGGKNASLGEMIGRLATEGIRVPGGFAVTADAYRSLLDDGVRTAIAALDGGGRIEREAVRAALREAVVPAELDAAIRDAYERLGSEAGVRDVAVAVRSSATLEDLPEASFAGQQESYLAVVGADAVVAAYRRCVVSLFGDRAIAYREEHEVDHLDIALSVGVQQMVRSDVGGSGVIFTLDPESGFGDMVLVDAAWGLGESVVGGVVDCDRTRVLKPLLDREGASAIVSRALGRKEVKVVLSRDGGTVTVDTTADERGRFVLDPEETRTLARWACRIERHYGRPMDIEWAKDGTTGDLFVVQARPETVHSRRDRGAMTVVRVRDRGPLLLEGLAVGQSAASGPVRVLTSPDEGDDFPDGAVLVAATTDPDWVPVLRRAAAIVTDRGGRTSHAAIVSREMGVPAVVGTRTATTDLARHDEVTVSCAEGDTGRVYDGRGRIDREEVPLEEVPSTRTHVMLNLADPDAAMRWWQLPADGIGLARMEFVVNEHIRAHPMALAHPERLDADDRAAIEALTAGWDSPAEYFVDRLATGLATLAAPWHPRPVVVRLSDFKTNEYASLMGGAPFEPTEANPMIGWRGASRYYDEGYRDGFALECRAICRVRDEIGLDNVVVMVPFCRTPSEADRVLEVMAEEGLRRGEGGLRVLVMAEIPANIILAEEFAARFDGFSIGSNDLTQLTLGVDRDSAELAKRFGADDPAVLTLVRDLIRRAHAVGVPVGFCGQAPSDDPAYAQLLVEAGIDSVSVTPDSFLAVKRRIAEAESLAGARSTP